MSDNTLDTQAANKVAETIEDAARKEKEARRTPSQPAARTPRKSAFETGLSYDDPAYADALELVLSQEFIPSSVQTERETITCQKPIEDAIFSHTETQAPRLAAMEEYCRIADLFRDKDGRIPIYEQKDGSYRSHPALEHFAHKMDQADRSYWNTLEDLDNALTVEVVVCIKEALSLAGVTDIKTTDEICRCVIRGGDLFDGGNIRQLEKFPPAASVLSGSVHCPHCGEESSTENSRCTHCERLIG